MICAACVPCLDSIKVAKPIAVKKTNNPALIILIENKNL
jgi:hypothetical protein